MNNRYDRSILAGRLLLSAIAGAALMLGLSAQPSAAQVCTAEQVGWIRYDPHITVTGAGNTIVKSSGGNGWGTTGAISTKSILSGDGYVEATVASNDYRVIFGLGNGDSSEDHTDIEFGIYLEGEVSGSLGDLVIYESGVAVENLGPTYAAEDVFRVAIEDGRINYYQNTQLLYTSAGVPTYPMLMDSALFHVNASVLDAQIQGCDLGDTSTPLPPEDPSLDVGTNVIIDSSSPLPPQPDLTNSTDLSGFYFYIDPGHGGTPTPLPVEQTAVSCPGESGYAYGAAHGGVREAEMALETGLRLRDLLQARGATVFLSRTTDRPVCLFQRMTGTDDTTEGHTIGNNTLYDARGGSANNWRFISIHYNSLSDSSFEQIQIIRMRYGYAYEAQQLGDLLAGWIDRTYNSATTPRVDYWTRYDELGGDPWVVGQSSPAGYGLMIEENFLSYQPFRDWVSTGDGSGARALGDSHFRALMDYWITGYTGPHSNLNSAIAGLYQSLLNSGADPGAPSAYASGPYVHTWGAARSQEFVSPTGRRASIIQSLSGGNAYYVGDPIWSEYVEKNGPNSYGPGLPLGAEHSWSTRRGVHWQRPGQSGLMFSYPQVINFQRGVITHNSTEGTIFLANCQAGGVYNTWDSQWTERLVRRFIYSNDRDGPRYQYPDGTWRNEFSYSRYNDDNVHTADTATRAQAAQMLMFAEGYPYYTGGNLFNDVSGHWARQWINMAASLGIIGGYQDGSFRTDNPLTRGQFTKILVNTRQWPQYQGTNQIYQDVPYGHTFYPYVTEASNRFILGGYPCGVDPSEPCVGPENRPYFRPDSHVTRAQISKMIDISYSYPNSPYSDPGACW